MSSEELKAFRRKKGWSQARLAKELEVSIHTVQAWEQGKNPIPKLIEKHLLSQLGVSIPIELILDINQVAKDENITFDEALFKVIREGIGKK